MKYKAVITGDIVDSTKSIEYREKLLNVINDTCNHLKNWIISFEIFRGDSFQILLDSPENAIRIALILRCALKSSTPNESHFKWDARLSIGIGTIEYYSKTLTSSDGEAFRLSGHGLETIKKRRLLICTPWEEFNECISVSTAFVDTLVTSWSVGRAYLMLKYFSTDNKKELEELLGVSQQNLSKKLIRSQTDNIDLYLEFFESQVRKLTK